MSTIRLSEQDSSQSQDAQLALRTYYVYIQSYVESIENSGPLKQAQEQLPGFHKLNRVRIYPNELQEPLLRGWFTLKAMESLPLDEHTELAMTANFWLPVQAYYAVHGVGLATLTAMGSDSPNDHRAFRSQVANQIVTKLLPYPFNMAVSGDPFRPSINTLQIENFKGNISEVISISNLSNPLYDKGELLVAKSLLTTRKHALQDLLKKARSKKVSPGRRRRNLPDHERQEIEKNLHPTTVFDFLYRIRVRSNYDDPEMYIYGQTDKDTAVLHYNNLVTMTKSLMACLEEIIQRKIGKENLEALWSNFTKIPTIKDN